VEISTSECGETVLTFVEVKGDSPVGRAGVVAGDKLLSVDGRPGWRYLQRHHTRPTATLPAKIEIERGGAVREIALAAE
jgi:predicted metalloprotease with PDZ domain